MRYRVFVQKLDHTFIEIAQTQYLEDAEAVYARRQSAMIVESDGEILQTKNLLSVVPTLF